VDLGTQRTGNLLTQGLSACSTLVSDHAALRVVGLATAARRN